MRTHRRARQILAVTLLATALCADRVVSAAPEFRPQSSETVGQRVGQIARTFAGRLAGAFRRSVVPVRFRPDRREGASAASPAKAFVRVSAPRLHPPLSPYQFRLPPPAAA